MDLFRKFKAGDTVFHRPTGETWLLIADEAGIVRKIAALEAKSEAAMEAVRAINALKPAKS